MERRAVPLSLVGFLALVGVFASLFALAGRTADGSEGYLAFVIPEGGPVVVTSDATDVLPPSTVSAVVGSVSTIALSLPVFGAADVLFSAAEDLGLDPLESRAVRTTQTWSYPDGRSRANTGVFLLTDSGYLNAMYFSTDSAAGPVLYLPPVIALPADLAPGSSTVSESLTNGLDPITVSVTVLGDAAAPSAIDGDPSGCIDVEARFDQEFADPGRTGYTIEQFDVWCPGRGTVLSRSESPLGSIISTVVAPGGVAWPAVERTPPSARPPGSELLSPILGTQILRAPQSTPTGLVMVNEPLSDLLELTVRDLAEGDPGLTWTAAWLQHPGGSLLGLASDDGIVAATTSRRTLQAFDPVGRILWLVDLPDVAVGSPVLLGSTVVTALVDGTLRGFAADSGAEIWSLGFPDTVSVSPVGTGGLALAADFRGRFLLVDSDGVVAASGELSPLAGPMSALSDGSFLVAQVDGVLTLLEGSGEERWSTSIGEGVVSSAAEVWGDVIAVPTSAGVFALDAATGALRWALPEFTGAHLGPRGLLADAGRVLQVTAEGTTSVLAEIRDPDGRVPIALFISRLGDDWVAVSSGGVLHYLAVPGE